MVNILILIFGIALLSMLIPENLTKYKGWVLSVFPLAGLLYFLSQLPGSGSDYPVFEKYSWIDYLGINFNFYLDGLSMLFALLILGVGVFILIYSNDYMKSYSHSGRFYFFILFFMGSMLGLVFSLNLIALFIFWELTSVSSFFLIGFFNHKEGARKAAIQALLVTGIGGLSLLSGIVLLGQVAGSFDLNEILQQKESIQSSPHYLTILLLFLAGIFTKSAQFPFHFWLPGAMQAPSPVSAYLHSATMVKAGVFLLFRMSSILGGTAEWTGIITLIGVFTMFVGAFMSLTKSDLKSILANTTVSALGILTMLLGLNTKLSVKAAILFLVIHSLYKATLFMAAGIIDKKTGTREISKLGQLFRHMPVLGVVSIVALLSMSGLPPMLGFIGKELIYESKYQLGGYGNIVLALGVLSNIMLVWVSGMLAYRTFFGKARSSFSITKRPSFSLLAGPVVLSLLSLVLGLSPGRLGELIIEPALIASRVEILDIKLKLWHGFNMVFFLSLITILAGVILFFFSEQIIPPLRKLTDRFFTYDFSGFFNRIFAGLLSFSTKKTNVIQHGYHRIYLMVIFIFSALLILYQLISTWGWEFSADFRDVRLFVVAIVLITSVSAVFVTITTSRMAAVVLLGMTGYGIALIYLIYGGIDLAITQILIETLTVVLFVLVIKRLPRFKKLSGISGRIRDLAIAIFVGAVITGLTLKAGFVEFQPPISRFFVENSLPGGFGKNVVNVILVDFRALDTLGEITVLTLAAAGIFAVLKFKTRS